MDYNRLQDPNLVPIICGSLLSSNESDLKVDSTEKSICDQFEGRKRERTKVLESSGE